MRLTVRSCACLTTRHEHVIVRVSQQDTNTFLCVSHIKTRTRYCACLTTRHKHVLVRVSHQDTNTLLCVSHNKTRIRRVPVNLLFIRLAQKHCSVIISTTSVLTCLHMTASSTVTKGVYVLCVFINSLMNYLMAFTYVTFCLI